MYNDTERNKRITRMVKQIASIFGNGENGPIFDIGDDSFISTALSLLLPADQRCEVYSLEQKQLSLMVWKQVPESIL